MLKLETLRSAHELDRLESRWKHLAKQSELTLFQDYELNRRAAGWFSARETPNVIVAESDSGLAIIPAVRRERELGLIGETLFDYRDVLSVGDSAVLMAAWRELASLKSPLEVTALRGDAARKRWQALASWDFCNAPITRRADISPNEFVKSHKKAAKASRRILREGLQLVRRERGLLEVAEWIYRRKSEWRGSSENLFLDRQRQDFMLNIVSNGVLNTSVWSYEARDGEIAAALVTFRNGNTRHLYTIHHDERWERFSPGQVLIFEVARQSLLEGLDTDFMTGEYPYKNRLATAMVPLYRVAASADQMASWNGALGMVLPAA